MRTRAITTLVPGIAGPRLAGLHVVCGCMFAGKTEALLDCVQAAPAAGTAVFKHRLDERYHAQRVVSHRRRSCEAVAVDRAEQLLEHIGSGVRLVAVDEGHFFDERLPDVCRAIIAARGAAVLVAALDKDSWGKAFPIIDRLRSLAGAVTVKSALCARCGRRATYTQRLTPIVNGNMVGGSESFEPRCYACWMPPPEPADQITRVASNTGPWVQHRS